MHDIERYRGHSLIASKPRGRGHTPGRSPRRVSQDYSPGPQQQQQHQGNGTGTGGGAHMEVVTTNGVKAQQSKVGYMMEGNNNNGGGGSAGSLAGMPLFSFMSHRRGNHHNQHHHPGSRQQLTHHQPIGTSRHGAPNSVDSTSSIKGHRALSQNQGHHYHQHQHSYHSQHYTHPSYQHDQDDHPHKSRQDSLGSSFDDCDDVDGLSFARLALGPPLIRGSLRGGQGRTCIIKDISGQQQENGPNTNGVSDTVSVTSDEGSTGHADNTLPRIIKPRKRRKKDRKPTIGSTSPPLTTEQPSLQQREQDDQAVSIVTLKPYMPMCFNYEAGAVSQDGGSKGCGQGGSRTCACSGCLSGHIFPTPPPSPASSSLASTMSSASSSCSSSSEDEAMLALRWDSHHNSSWGGRGPLVRSLSEPQATPPTLHITSSVGHSPFGNHRDLDIRLFRSDPLDVLPSSDNGQSASRTRHWSVPGPRQPYLQSPNSPYYSEPSRGSSMNSITDNDKQEYYKHQLRKVTTPHPPQRPWIPISTPDRTKPSCIFTVLCYNVLCDKYATRQMYGYCPSWALEWEYRKKGIMDEIRNICADIITLQEVETDQFYNFFLPELKADGYDGIFSPKSRAKHMAENERKFVDGCAIFWRITKFCLVKDHLVEFNKLAMANHDGSEDMLNRVMTKDNIGLAALLETKEAAWENSSVMPNKNQINQPVLVCTAHVHWDPEFCDVKLIQTIMLMSEVKAIMPKILEEARQSRPGLKIDASNINFLLCGDLNSLPESGVIEFLTKSSVSMDHEDFKGLEYKSSLLKWAPTRHSNAISQNTQNVPGHYTHAFKIAAAYDFNIMPYTNYTYDFKGIIDYIFHSVENMNCLGVLGPIEPEWFRENRIQGCPHPHIPSDHFPLLVQLELKLIVGSSSSSSSNTSSSSSSGNAQPNGLLHR